jgi:hypothetical protein
MPNSSQRHAGNPDYEVRGYDEEGDEIWGLKPPDHVPVPLFEATDEDIVCSEAALARSREAVERAIAADDGSGR